MGCTPTLAVVLVVAVLETSDEVTAVVVVVVVVLVVYCTCSSANMHTLIAKNNYSNNSVHSIYQQGYNRHAYVRVWHVCIYMGVAGIDIFKYLSYGHTTKSATNYGYIAGNT